MVAIAARHGESKRLKSRKLNPAAADGNHVATPCATTAGSSVSPATFARTPIVVTIASFAENPEREAATGCHLPNPSGVKITAITLPMDARILSAESSTAPKLPSINPYPPRNHITIQASSRIVPAFLMNPLSLSHVWSSTVFACGRWYAGSSITNGAASPWNGFVFFRIIAETSTVATPITYMINVRDPAGNPVASEPITPAIKAIALHHKVQM